MKRLGVSVSMNSSYRSSADKEIQSILDNLDEEDYGEETVQVAEKKRRLSVEQVKSLEKIFEMENKLNPERKMKLAQDFGLQPRQVAVWFQNRRARWKTKQLERDYEILKSNYEALRTNYDALISDKESLLLELKDLKSKFKEDNGDIKVTVKDVIVPTESANRLYQQTKFTNPIEEKIGQIDQNRNRPSGSLMFVNLKDGSSDSDSSTIFNEDNTSAGTLAVILSDQTPTQQNYCSSPTTHEPERWESWVSEDNPNVFYSSVKIEENNPLNTEVSCNFFSDQEAPRLSWFSSEQWNFEEEDFL